MTHFSELEARIHIRFSNPELLKEAFSHKTYSRETGTPSYERLEFLGDSLLNFIVGDYLFSSFSEEEGVLTKKRSTLVCETALKQASRDLGLEEFILIGEELKQDKKFNIHGDDLYESLLGAIYCDCGLDAAKHFVERTLLRDPVETVVDYKSRLQEMVQKKYRSNALSYRSSEIDVHAIGEADRFEATVYIQHRPIASGRGRNKKVAESHAAKEAIRRIEHGEV